MSSESIAAFYAGTSFGQDLLAKGREDSLAKVLAILIRGKFGDQPKIDLVSRRLARLDEEPALSAVECAASFQGLLDRPIG